MNDGDKTSFYTSLYHTMLGPTLYADVIGLYRGLDQNTHYCEDFINYTTFSLWDTYRAQHPLLNLLFPHRNADMIKSMLAHFDQSSHKMLPVWSHYANENWCMIGYHSVSVIADAIVKGNQMFNVDQALATMIVTSTNKWYDGLESYMKLGYVPEDEISYSVSRTLEYAYDDWAISQAARVLGKTDVADYYARRAENYKNVFDKSTKFMRPRLKDGTFKADFDPLDTHGQGFIEGNSWNYSLYVPHDVDGLIELHGGRKAFENYLDSIFTMELPDRYFENTEDISRDGIMGNYVHGNEPSHHVPYLYNWTDSPHKTQATVRKVMKAMYRPEPHGLGGNDDLGQMSAWYVFSALGFYPVAPGSPDYQLGSPLVKSAELHFINGTSLKISATNQSDKNVYVKRVLLNGKPLENYRITHDQVTGGGELVFEMSAKPSR
jgi:predicted alpha-1,2-mannosidase